MGIRELWQGLSPVFKTRTLTQVSVSEGFEMNRWLERCIRVGIDASIWMNEAQRAIDGGAKRGAGTQAGENPVLQILFYRLCQLASLPIIPVFVFDGPERPARKHNTNVKSKPYWLTERFQLFISAFTFSWYMAPGEAEAELAELNRRHLIDAIVSEDTDTIIFGAQCVIQMPNTKTAGDEVTVITADAIQSDPSIALTHEGAFLMGLLCRSDYGPGLKNCGWMTARKLAQSELADSLFKAATRYTKSELNEFLVDWCEKFKNLLLHDPKGLLGQKYPSLAAKVGNMFPSADIIHLFACPVTSWSNYDPPDSSAWMLGLPDPAQLGVLCEKYFSWFSFGVGFKKFGSHLWAGILIRRLIKIVICDANIDSAASLDTVSSLLSGIHILQIVDVKLGPGPPRNRPNVAGYVVKFSTNSLASDAISTLAQDQRPELPSTLMTATAWVPGSILTAAFPRIVEQYRRDHPNLNVNQASSDLPLVFPSLDDFIVHSPGPDPLLRLSPPVVLDIGPSPSSEPSRPLPLAGPPGDSISDPIVIGDYDSDDSMCSDIPYSPFVQGSSQGTHVREEKTIFLGIIDLCTPSP